MTVRSLTKSITVKRRKAVQDCVAVVINTMVTEGAGSQISDGHCSAFAKKFPQANDILRQYNISHDEYKTAILKYGFAKAYPEHTIVREHAKQ